jgi:hypothetical protein
MDRRGRKRRLLLEDEYWQLIQSGVGTVEACRRVGIGRKTGYRLRHAMRRDQSCSAAPTCIAAYCTASHVLLSLSA